MPAVTWFCVDIECSGPVPGLYDMVSLGAVVVNDADDGALSLGESFYIELRPEAGMDPEAMAVNGLDYALLLREGVPRGQAIRQLAAWVKAQTRPGTKPVFVGHNAPFDWSFVAWCYAAEGLPNPFGYKAFDTKAFSAGVLGLHWLDTNKENLSVALGLPDEDHGKKHRADYDAWYQALILKGLLERQRAPRTSSPTE